MSARHNKGQQISSKVSSQSLSQSESSVSAASHSNSEAEESNLSSSLSSYLDLPTVAKERVRRQKTLHKLASQEMENKKEMECSLKRQDTRFNSPEFCFGERPSTEQVIQQESVHQVSPIKRPDRRAFSSVILSNKQFELMQMPQTRLTDNDLEMIKESARSHAFAQESLLEKNLIIEEEDDSSVSNTDKSSQKSLTSVSFQRQPSIYMKQLTN